MRYCLPICVVCVSSHLWPVVKQILFWQKVGIRSDPPPGWSKRPNFSVFFLMAPLTAFNPNQMGRRTDRTHIFQFTKFIKPAHWGCFQQVLPHLISTSIISSTCWDCWNVDVTVDIGVGAVLQGKLDMQGHPYLGDGEGGAGVLLAVAGSLMRE